MKERPIIMSAESVRGILAGTKSQTRRVMKRQPLGNITDAAVRADGLWRIEHAPVPLDGGGNYVGLRIRCPFGAVGDRLWAREAWRIMGLMYEEEPCIQYKADLAEQPCYVPDDWLDMRWEDWYERQSAKIVEDCEKAGLKPNNDYDELYRWERDTCPTRWQSPIHMPKFAARIWLSITDIRVERLQEISEKDIQAEGIEPDMIDSGAADPNMGTGIDIADYYEPFIHLWDSLNAKRGYGWSEDPWTWVVSFKVVS